MLFFAQHADDVLFSVLLLPKKSLYGPAERIAGLWESVAEKRVRVEKFRREQRLSSIVSAQVRQN
jgi:hypothetical protein